MQEIGDTLFEGGKPIDKERISTDMALLYIPPHSQSYIYKSFLRRVLRHLRRDLAGLEGAKQG